MSLFKKRCEYCKEKIDKGKEVFRDVKVPVFIGTKRKSFCCSKHADSYEYEVSNAENCKRSCCG